MEDALVQLGKNEDVTYSYYVLILVLMEDALVLRLLVWSHDQITISLNPCFNGRCTRTL